MILAVDPGNTKCGLAVVTNKSVVVKKLIVNTSRLTGIVNGLCSEFTVSVIVIGDRTNSKEIHSALVSEIGVPVVMVDEDKSSLEGRYRYVKENTRGLARILPLGLRIPREPYDDYVAVILAERFLKKYPDFSPFKGI